MPGIGTFIVTQGRVASGRLALVAGLFVGANFAFAMPSPLSQTRSSNSPKVSETNNVIRVRVSQVRSATFTVSGVYLQISSPTEPIATAPGVYSAVRISKTVSDGETTWIVVGRDTKRLFAKIKGDRLLIDGENLRLNLKPVPNSLVLDSRNRGATDVIATLDLESYLKGVLPAEMPASWPIEALKAQAVAARTFALFRKTRKSVDRAYDLDSDVSDQMFQSPLADTKLLENVDRAIRETKGETLEDQHHQVFAAYFHADCGGHTEEARDVWGTGEKLGTTTDAGCPLNPKAQWSLTVASERLAKVFAQGKQLPRQLKAMAAISRTESGRVATMRLAWNDGSETLVGGNEFRKALGFDQLKSTQFTFAKQGNTYLFKGQGFGHGVGLCQWGARQMAKAGRSYREILSHYYPRAISNRKNDLKNEERDRTYDKNIAQFHKPISVESN